MLVSLVMVLGLFCSNVMAESDPEIPGYTEYFIRHQHQAVQNTYIFAQDDFEVQIYVTDWSDKDAIMFNWSSNISVSYVYVKGGPDGNTYTYGDPDSLNGSGLQTPINTAKNEHYPINYIIFYVKPQLPPPPPQEVSYYSLTIKIIGEGTVNTSNYGTVISSGGVKYYIGGSSITITAEPQNQDLPEEEVPGGPVELPKTGGIHAELFYAADAVLVHYLIKLRNDP